MVPIPPSFQDGIFLAALPDTACLANFRVCLRHEVEQRAGRNANAVTITAFVFLAEQRWKMRVCVAERRWILARDEVSGKQPK